MQPRQKRSFDDAVRRLNSGNINELWELCALISVLEYYGGTRLKLFPELHYEHPRLFCEAILKSKASLHRHRQYTPEEFIAILNWSQEGLYDPRVEELGGTGTSQELQFQLIRTVSRWANIQMRFQNVQNGALGRTLALWVDAGSGLHFWCLSRYGSSIEDRI